MTIFVNFLNIFLLTTPLKFTLTKSLSILLSSETYRGLFKNGSFLAKFSSLQNLEPVILLKVRKSYRIFEIVQPSPEFLYQ